MQIEKNELKFLDILVEESSTLTYDNDFVLL